MTPYKKVIFSVLTVCLFFGSAEGILRLAYRPNRPFRFYAPHPQSVVARDSDLGYRLRPNFTGIAYSSLVQTNSLGFRGPEFDRVAMNRLRLIALGDSCTFGYGVSDNNHTYPAQLSRLLRKRYPDAEVINAGTVGYTSYQALKLLEKQLIDFHPDILLIYVGWNDLGNSILPEWTPTMTQEVQESNFLTNSESYILLALSDMLSRVGRPPRLGFKPEAIESYGSNVRKIIEIARHNGIEPVLVTWPTRVRNQIAQLRATEVFAGTGITFESWFSFYERYQKELRNLGAENNVVVIPLDDRLNSESENLFHDEIHLTDAGSAQAAKIIFDVLSNSLLKGSGSE